MLLEKNSYQVEKAKGELRIMFDLLTRNCLMDQYLNIIGMKNMHSVISDKENYAINDERMKFRAIYFQLCMVPVGDIWT